MALSIKRRTAEKKIIKRRLNQIKGSTNNKDVEQPHRLSKKPSLGCRKSKCRLCHPEKYK